MISRNFIILHETSLNPKKNPLDSGNYSEYRKLRHTTFFFVKKICVEIITERSSNKVASNVVGIKIEETCGEVLSK